MWRPSEGKIKVLPSTETSNITQLLCFLIAAINLMGNNINNLTNGFWAAYHTK